MSWGSAQEFESDWWGDCRNTFGEEYKQTVYAKAMGIQRIEGALYPSYTVGNNKSVVDLGGGPVSLLLKTYSLDKAVVVDPCPYPDWVMRRYEQVNIDYVAKKAEEFETEDSFDEAWIYNVLQHVEDPEKAISVARSVATRVRIFEWVEWDEPDEWSAHGHPHVLHAEELSKWLHGPGKTDSFQPFANEQAGTAFYGVFE